MRNVVGESNVKREAANFVVGANAIQSFIQKYERQEPLQKLKKKRETDKRGMNNRSVANALPLTSCLPWGGSQGSTGTKRCDFLFSSHLFTTTSRTLPISLILELTLTLSLYIYFASFALPSSFYTTHTH